MRCSFISLFLSGNCYASRLTTALLPGEYDFGLYPWRVSSEERTVRAVFSRPARLAFFDSRGLLHARSPRALGEWLACRRCCSRLFRWRARGQLEFQRLEKLFPFILVRLRSRGPYLYWPRPRLVEIKNFV